MVAWFVLAACSLLIFSYLGWTPLFEYDESATGVST